MPTVDLGYILYNIIYKFGGVNNNYVIFSTKVLYITHIV